MEIPTTYIVSHEQKVMPEGIAVTGDGTIYVTSAGNGAVYRGDTREPAMKPFLPAGSDGRIHATGTHVDKRGRITDDAVYVTDSATGVIWRAEPDDFPFEPGRRLRGIGTRQPLASGSAARSAPRTDCCW